MPYRFQRRSSTGLARRRRTVKKSRYRADSIFKCQHLSRYHADSFSKFAQLSSGDPSSATGTLVVKSTKASLARTRVEYPHDCFIKYHVMDAKSFLTETVPEQLDHRPFTRILSWGMSNYTYTPSSQDTKHMAWMVWELNRPQGIWDRYATGCTLVPALAAYTVAQSPYCRNSMVSTEASGYHQQCITVDRIPASSDDRRRTAIYSHQHYLDEVAAVQPRPNLDPPVVGTEPTTEAYVNPPPPEGHRHFTGTTKSYTDTASLGPVELTTGLGMYQVPNHVVSGVDIDLKFLSGSNFDQIVSIKLCRVVEELPQTHITAHQYQALLNEQKITDGRMLETIYQHSFLMPSMSAFKTLKNRSVSVKKFIKCNYARSVVRCESSLTADPSNTSMGGMYDPSINVDLTDSMYNNLILCATSKVVDDTFVGLKTLKTSAPVAPHSWAQSSNVTVPELVDPSDSLSETVPYAMFGATGSITQRFKVENYYHRSVPLLARFR